MLCLQRGVPLRQSVTHDCFHYTARTQGQVAQYHHDHRHHNHYYDIDGQQTIIATNTIITEEPTSTIIWIFSSDWDQSVQ